MYTVYGKPRKISTELLDRALVFASEFLDLDTDLDIDFEDEFDKGKCGYCDIDDGHITVFINPKMTKKEIVATLFHELVHARQIVRKELVPQDGLPSKWMGRIFRDHFEMPYEELPWEKEAYHLEDQMMRSFKPL